MEPKDLAKQPYVLRQGTGEPTCFLLACRLASPVGPWHPDTALVGYTWRAQVSRPLRACPRVRKPAPCAGGPTRARLQSISGAGNQAASAPQRRGLLLRLRHDCGAFGSNSDSGSVGVASASALQQMSWGSPRNKQTCVSCRIGGAELSLKRVSTGKAVQDT